MDTVKPAFVGSPAVQGPTLPGSSLPGATSGFFGSGGDFSLASTLKTTSALATGVGGFAGFSAGKMQGIQYDIQAKSYEQRAEVVKLNAIEKSNYLRKQLLADLGQANANAAARGIDTGSGSAVQVRTESIGNVSRDIAKIKAGGNIEASNELTSAARSRIEGQNTKLATYIRTAGGLGKYALSQVL